MKNNRLVKKGLALVIVVMIIKIIGFLKQSVIAWRFGTSPELDSYFAADGYISMFGQIILTAIPPAIITIYLKMNEKKEKDRFVSSVLVFLTTFGVLLTLANIIISPLLADILGVSFDDHQIQELSKFIVLLSPLILFACVSSVSSGVLQSKNHFIPEKMLGLFLSVGIIICAYFLAPVCGIDSLLIGFMSGYLLYFVMMLVLLLKNNSIRIKNPLRDKAFKKFLKIVCPIVVGVCIVDASHLVDRIVASSLASGSVSALYYSQILSGDLINGVIIASIGMLLLPKLSSDVQIKKKSEILYEIEKILRVMIPIILLLMVIYLVVGEQLVSVVFERGAFTQDATIIVSGCVVGYSFGFILILIKEVLVRYFYACEDTKTPMIANIVGILINVLLSLLLSAKIGVQGIAYATSISYFISNVVLLVVIKKREKGYQINTATIKDLLKNVTIVLLSLLVGFFTKNIVCSNTIIELIVTTTTVSFTFIVFSVIIKTAFGRYFANLIHKAFKRKE